MKSDIHPVYYDNATVTCSCGNTWVTGSTMESINTDLCSKCHPFYTGEQRIVDTEGQVERFYRKLEARQQYTSEEEDNDVNDIVLSEISLEDIGLSKRAITSLASANISNASDILESIESGGEESLLSISGFGRKSLIDLKKSLRAMGVGIFE